MGAGPVPGAGLGALGDDDLFQDAGVKVDGSKLGGFADIHHLQGVGGAGTVGANGEAGQKCSVAQVDGLKLGCCSREAGEFGELAQVQFGEQGIVDAQGGKGGLCRQGEGRQGGATDTGGDKFGVLTQIQFRDLGAIAGNAFQSRASGYIQRGKGGVVSVQAGQRGSAAQFQGFNGGHASDGNRLEGVEVAEVDACKDRLGAITLGNGDFLQLLVLGKIQGGEFGRGADGHLLEVIEALDTLEGRVICADVEFGHLGGLAGVDLEVLVVVGSRGVVEDPVLERAVLEDGNLIDAAFLLDGEFLDDGTAQVEEFDLAGTGLGGKVLLDRKGQGLCVDRTGLGDGIGDPALGLFFNVDRVFDIGHDRNDDIAALDRGVLNRSGGHEGTAVEDQGTDVAAALAVNGIDDNLGLGLGTGRHLEGTGSLVRDLDLGPPVAAGHGIHAGRAAADTDEGVRNGRGLAGDHVDSLAVIDHEGELHKLVDGELGTVCKCEDNGGFGLLDTGEHGVTGFGRRLGGTDDRPGLTVIGNFPVAFVDAKLRSLAVLAVLARRTGSTVIARDGDGMAIVIRQELAVDRPIVDAAGFLDADDGRRSVLAGRTRRTGITGCTRGTGITLIAFVTLVALGAFLAMVDGDLGVVGEGNRVADYVVRRILDVSDFLDIDIALEFGHDVLEAGDVRIDFRHLLLEFGDVPLEGRDVLIVLVEALDQVGIVVAGHCQKGCTEDECKIFQFHFRSVWFMCCSSYRIGVRISLPSLTRRMVIVCFGACGLDQKS